jgi:hypothetical protein
MHSHRSQVNEASTSRPRTWILRTFLCRTHPWVSFPCRIVEVVKDSIWRGFLTAGSSPRRYESTKNKSASNKTCSLKLALMGRRTLQIGESTPRHSPSFLSNASRAGCFPADALRVPIKSCMKPRVSQAECYASDWEEVEAIAVRS